MTFLAISGKRRTGKSTLAHILYTNYNIVPLSLAGPLKDMCMEQFGLTWEQVDGELKEIIDKRYNKTPRQIMIETGQFYRSINKDFWINKLINKAVALERDIIAVPDVRFKNEIDKLKKHGAMLVRLERDEAFTGTNIQDASETELDNYKDWDFLLPAAFNTDMTDLERAAERIYVGISQKVG